MVASTGPMQGAAQTAKAPPRRAREPRRRAPSSELGRDNAVEPRERQEAHEGESEHDDDHVRRLWTRRVVVDEPAGRARQRAERDEDQREAGDERDARRRRPSGRPRRSATPETAAR